MTLDLVLNDNHEYKPLYFSDDFSSTKGGWSGSGTVAGGMLTITPTVGPTELLIDSGFEAWTSATNLTNWSEGIAGTTTVNQETSVVRSGSNAVRIDVDGSNSNGSVAQAVSGLSVGAWYTITFWSRSDSGIPTVGMDAVNAVPASAFMTVNNVYTQQIFTARATNTAITLNLKRNSAAGRSLYFDDAAFKLLSTLFYGRLHSVPYANVTWNYTRTPFTQFGAFLNGNHPSNPTIYTHVYDVGNGTHNIDYVNGASRTPIGSYNFTYSAGMPITATVHKNMTIDLKADTTTLVSGVAATGAAGKHFGLFSTSALNSCTSIVIDSRSVS